MLKKLGALTLAASMFVSSTAFAATSANQGALSQGMPATVKQAQSHDDRNLPCWLLGAAVVIGGIVLLASGNGNNVGPITTCPLTGCVHPHTNTTTTTTTTGP